MKYINPGYAEFLDADGGTTIEDAATAHGVAFYQPTDDEGVNLAVAIDNLYGRFDFYFPATFSSLPSNYFLKVGVYKPGNYNAGFNGISLYKYSSSYIHIRPWVCGGYEESKAHTNFQMNLGGINQFYFRFKGRSANAADGEYQIYLNGVRIFNATGKQTYFDNTTKLVVYAASELCTISNLILSDTAFDMKERITAVPLGSPVTDMIDRGDGSYLAESSGQQILQTVDVVSLISAYGGGSQVTGIAVAGKPAYRTADGLTSLIGLSKSAGVQTEHGTKTLKTDTMAGVIDCHGVNMTLADMAGMQLGWKAGN